MDCFAPLCLFLGELKSGLCHALVTSRAAKSSLSDLAREFHTTAMVRRKVLISCCHSSFIQTFFRIIISQNKVAVYIFWYLNEVVHRWK